MSYTHYTKEQKDTARQTDLYTLLHSQGEKLKRSGSEYEWRDGSAKVTIRGNLWFHQYEQKGGDAIDFVRRFYNKTFSEAMDYLLGGGSAILVASPVVKKETKPFALPKRNDNARRVYAYLAKHRGIDRGVLDAFIAKGLIYESAEYHNAVFVGYDKSGDAKHANLRGTGTQSSFKGNVEGSLPEYSFHWNGTSDRLYLFEAPIDLLSFISLHKRDWQRHSFAACCGVGDRVLFQMLKDNPHIQAVALCLDNDDAGLKANRRITEKLSEQGILSKILAPTAKDWNEDLLCPPKENMEIESEVTESCQVLRL